jgi:hypothetical protein
VAKTMALKKNTEALKLEKDKIEKITRQETNLQA